ncbi:MAG: DUF2807 domain-containing protein [Myxococcaceae bacterium]
MNQHLVGSVCGGLFFVMLAGCGPAHGLTPSGRVVADERTVDAFTSVRAVGTFQVRASPGPRRVTVTADDNLQSAIETTVEGGELVVRTRPGTNLLGFTQLEVEVQAETLQGVSVESTARADVTLSPGVDALVHAGSSAEAVVSVVDARAVRVESASSSTVRLSGNAASVAAVVSNSSQLEAAALSAGAVSLDVRAASNVRVNASGRVSGTVSGASHVVLRGSPVVELQVTEASTLTRE